MPEITRDRCITPSFSPSTYPRRKLMDGEGLSSSGTENLHRHRIVSGNTHIADEHGSIRCETRRKTPPFASEFCYRKSQRTPVGVPVSGNSGVLRNSHIRQLSNRRAGAAGGDGHRARAGSSCRYVGFLFRCYSDPGFSSSDCGGRKEVRKAAAAEAELARLKERKEALRVEIAALAGAACRPVRRALRPLCTG